MNIKSDKAYLIEVLEDFSCTVIDRWDKDRDIYEDHDETYEKGQDLEIYVLDIHKDYVNIRLEDGGIIHGLQMSKFKIIKELLLWKR